MNVQTTRTSALVACVLAVALALAGCGGGAPAADQAAAPAPAAGFPVTIATAYGDITVPAKPERIVVLNGRHIELLHLLDEKPVAFTDYGATNAELLTSYPWMTGTFEGEADPKLFVGGSEPSAEAIAAYDPDLILTTIWQTDERLYGQLSQIAPTYVGIEKDNNTSWQDDLTALARLTGHDTAVVGQTQSRLDAAMAAAAQRLPGLQGKTFQLAILTDGEQFSLTDFGISPLLGLGLRAGEGQPVSGGATKDFSRENVEALNADTVFISTRSQDYVTQLQADTRMADRPASRNGTLVYLDNPQWLAINGGTAVSELWWLEQMVPKLEASALNSAGR